MVALLLGILPASLGPSDPPGRALCLALALTLSVAVAVGWTDGVAARVGVRGSGRHGPDVPMAATLLS